MFARHIHMRPDARPRKKLSRPYRDAWSIGEKENEFHRAIRRCETHSRRSAESRGRSTPYNASRARGGSATAERYPSELIRAQKESVGAGEGG